MGTDSYHSKLHALLLLVYVCSVTSQDVCDGCLCDPSDIDVTTVKETYNVRKIIEDSSTSWALDINITWAAPLERNNNYAVELTKHNGGALRCFDTRGNEQIGESFSLICPIRSSQHHVTGELYTERDISFGYRYIFDVCLYNATENALARSSICVINILSPDCYEVTQNEDFCRNQPIAVSGKPVNASLLRFATGEIVEGNRTVDVDLVWSDPIQLNGAINSYTVETFDLAPPNKRKDQQTVLFGQGEGNTSRYYEIRIRGLFFDTQYRVKITPWIVLASNNVEDGLKEEVIFTTPLGLPMESKETPTTNASSNPTAVVQTTMSDGVTTRLDPGLDVLTASLVSVASSISLIILLVLGVVCVRQFRHKDHLTALAVKQKLPVPDRNIVNLAFKDKEVGHKDVKMGERLGAGQFGVVHSGTFLRRIEPRRHVPVAVKTVKDDVSDLMKLDFLNEIHLMIEIGPHQNVLEVLACCTVKLPYYLITEILEYGDLLHFLRKCNKPEYIEKDIIYNIANLQRYQMARQIACGMVYISSKLFYHGDLAARNILVGSNLVVKISDFGLSSDIYEVGYQRLSPDRKRPIKWASIETNLEGKCTIQSDIWSYGVVLYEIFTNGGVPYKDIGQREVIRRVRDGYRMEKPENCPNDVYEKMVLCWHEKPNRRPPFTDLFNFFDEKIEKASPSDYIQVASEDHLPTEKTDFHNTRQKSATTDGDCSTALSGEPVDIQNWEFARHQSTRTQRDSNDAASNYSDFNVETHTFERYQDSDITG